MNSKGPNKRTVFKSESDSENEDSPERKRRRTVRPARNSSNIRKRKSESANKVIIKITLNKKLSQWPYLEVRGPYHSIFFLFKNDTIKNQPLCKLIRQLLMRIYENANEYKEKIIPTIIQRFDETTPEIEDAITTAEEMCRKLFRFRDSDGFFVNLYEDDMISPIKEMFFARELKVDYNTKRKTLHRLQALCMSKRVDATTAQLEDVRNGFVNYVFQFAVDLLPCVFSIDIVLYPGKLSSYRAADFSMSESFHAIAEWYSRPPRFSRIAQKFLYRDRKPPSLWLLIPCELKYHLLEHVFEFGLIELLPKKARSLLYHWILDVRKRMRNRLIKGDLRNKIEQYMSAVNKNERLSADDARVEGVISAVLENALNSKEFKVFDGEWKNFTLNFIKTMDRHQFHDVSSNIIRDVCQNMHPASLQRLSSCYSNSETDKTLLSHTLHQVLHFTIRFALNTLRHVFRINRYARFCIRFDGQLEEVVTDFSDYSRNMSPEKDFIGTQEMEDTPQSSETRKTPPTVQVIRPRKTLLPTPVNTSPLASRCDDFYQRMPASDYRCSPIQSTCNSNYATSGPELFHAQQFESKDKNSGGDVKKSFFTLSSVVTTMKHPNAEPLIISSLSEEKEEELPKANALRQPSVSSFTQIDDFEGVPSEWIIEYKAAFDTNQKLLAELERAKERLAAISK